MILSAEGELRMIIDNIDHAIDEIKRWHPDPFRARTPDGRYIMLDALSAKANALAALANLEVARCRG